MSVPTLAIALLLGCACRGQPDKASTMTPPDDANLNAKPDAEQRPAAFDLGPSLRPIAFAPGRYAALVRRNLSGTHSAQRLRENASASFVLELAADGTAKACRGWMYRSSNDGPKVRTSLRFDEQQGYKGQHQVRGSMVEVVLQADDAECTRIRNSETELLRTSPIRLECVLASPDGHGFLTSQALLCRWDGVPTDEARAHIIPDVAPGEWMVLGSGNGLRFTVTGPAAGAHVAPPTSVTAETPDAPVARDAWQVP